MNICNPNIKILCALVFLPFLIKCGSSNDPVDTTTDIPIDPISYDVIGHVTDVNHQPINFASITGGTSASGSILSSSTGVFIGEMGAVDNTWIQISANGYVTNYAQSSGQVNGSNIITTRLTPVGSWEVFQAGNASTVFHDTVSADIPADLFTASDVIVEVTKLEPIHSGASYALTADNEFIGFKTMFSITAKDFSNNAVAFDTGKLLTVTLTLDNPVTTTPPLYYFNIANGSWDEMTSACNLSDDTHVICDLPHLSTFGLGDGAQEYSLPYPDPSTIIQSETNLDHCVALIQEASLNNGDVGAAVDLALLALSLDANLALEYAELHPDEDGKMRLMWSMANHASFGTENILLAEKALEITEEIAQEYINENPCGKISEIREVIAQLETLDSIGTTISELQDKISVAYAACDLWEGEVTVLFNHQPYWQNEFHLLGGGGWNEHHDIELNLDQNASNPAEISFTGEDDVRIGMSDVLYKKFVVDICGTGWIDMKLHSNPNTSNGTLSISGSYAVDSSNPFTVSDVSEPSGYITALEFQMESYVYTSDCILFPIITPPIPYIPTYQSILSNNSISTVVPFTLQQLLNDGFDDSDETYDYSRGNKIFSIFIDPSIPWSVVHQARVQWQFRHLKLQEDE